MSCFMYCKRFLILTFFFVCCAHSSALGSPSDEKTDGAFCLEVFDCYCNQDQDNPLINANTVEESLKQRYTQIALQKFNSDLSLFYTTTMGTLVQRQKDTSLGGFKDSSAEKCIKILNEFVAEKSAIALGRISRDQDAPEDPLVNRLIENLNNDFETKALRTQLEGIVALAESSVSADLSNRSSNSSLIIPSATISATLVGAVLFWYGSDYLTVMTETILPYFWLAIWGKEIPAIGSYDYELYYAPLKKCTFIAFAPVWTASTSIATWGTVNVWRWSSRKFHKIYNALLHHALRLSHSSQTESSRTFRTETSSSQAMIEIPSLIHEATKEIEGDEWIWVDQNKEV